MFNRKDKETENNPLGAGMKEQPEPKLTEPELPEMPAERGETSAREQIPSAEKPPIPEKKKPGTLRLLWRWLLVALSIFALGGLAVTLLFYLPMRRDLTGAQSSLQSELEGSQARTAELEEQVGNLEALESRNRELEEELAQTRAHLILVSTQADIAAARLAMEQEDLAGARSALTGATRSLESMTEILQGEQLAAVEAMQSRLKLASDELEDDIFAAESDLNVLATNLLQLENSLFAGE